MKLNRSFSDSDKKVHQGWGGDEPSTELKAEEAGTTDAQDEGAGATDGWDAVPVDDPWAAPPPTDPWAAPPPEGDSTPAPGDEKADDDRKPRERELEEEDNTMSYDQYVAQLRETTTSSIPKLEGIRGANEGDEEVWGNVTEHKRNEDEEAYFVGKVRSWVLDWRSPPNIQHSRLRARPRFALKRKRKFTSRSTHISIGPAVEGVVAVVIVDAIAVVVPGDAVVSTVHSLR
jgi:hypothetical protein